MRKQLSCAAILVLALAAPAFAEDDPVVERATAVRALFREDPGGFEDLFDPSFLNVIPADQVRTICSDLFRKHGACTGATLVEKKGQFTGIFLLDFEKGVAIQSTVSVAGKPPHRIVGWWMGPPQPAVTELAGVQREFEKLEGTVSFAVARLGGDKSEFLASLNQDTPLAVGSAFKLYVLGGVVRAVEAETLRWDMVVPLRKEWRSLPSGQAQEWPADAPVTVHTLATLMISVSDNTATDHLLFTVGRRAVEEVQIPMGNQHAARNIPFLSTLELFKLKCVQNGVLGTTFLEGEAEKRRTFLDGKVRGIPMEDVDLSELLKPVRIDTIEWFASGADLVRAVDWLRCASSTPAGQPLLGILGVNKGIQINSTDWPYVGFKGGSEPGVLNGTFLLRHRSGQWFALSAGWNNPKKNVDTTAFFGLIQRTVSVLAKTLKE